MTRKRGICTAAVMAFVLAGNPAAEQQTIPEQLAKAGKNLAGGPSAPSGIVGKQDPVEVLLRDTDTVVRGYVGEAGTPYLSDDQMDVHTDYRIVDPVFLYRDDRGAPPPAGGAGDVRVTLPGGRITINGLSYTSRHAALPSLKPGTEVLLLLKRAGDRYRLAATYHGAFRIVADGTLAALSRTPGFQTIYKDVPASDAEGELVYRLRVLRQ